MADYDEVLKLALEHEQIAFFHLDEFKEYNADEELKKRQQENLGNEAKRASRREAFRRNTRSIQGTGEKDLPRKGSPQSSPISRLLSWFFPNEEIEPDKEFATAAQQKIIDDYENKKRSIRGFQKSGNQRRDKDGDEKRRGGNGDYPDWDYPYFPNARQRQSPPAQAKGLKRFFSWLFADEKAAGTTQAKFSDEATRLAIQALLVDLEPVRDDLAALYAGEDGLSLWAAKIRQRLEESAVLQSPELAEVLHRACTAAYLNSAESAL